MVLGQTVQSKVEGFRVRFESGFALQSGYDELVKGRKILPLILLELN